MITVIDDKTRKQSLSSIDIPLGATFRGKIRDSTVEGIFTRSYDRIVLLNNPYHCWICTKNDFPIVDDVEFVDVEVRVI
jgi:hypothetical protein